MKTLLASLALLFAFQAFAEDSPAPGLEELYSDVYVNIDKNLSPTRPYVHGAKNPLL